MFQKLSRLWRDNLEFRVGFIVVVLAMAVLLIGASMQGEDQFEPVGFGVPHDGR